MGSDVAAACVQVVADALGKDAAFSFGVSFLFFVGVQLRIEGAKHFAFIVEQLHEDAVVLPIALRRGETDAIGVAEHGGNLTIDGVEVRRLAREEGLAAGDAGNLFEHPIGMRKALRNL